MDITGIMKAAAAAFASDLGKQALNGALGLLPDSIASYARITLRTGPKATLALRSFLDGGITKEELQAQWDDMLADGEVADAIVAAGEAARQAGQPSS